MMHSCVLTVYFHFSLHLKQLTSRRKAAWFGPTTHCLIVACSNTFKGGWLVN